MKKENKELLLKDLCGRLPYDIKCKIEMWIGCDVCTIYNINSIGYVEIVEDSDTNGISIEKIKPYLYPLLSMTSKQKAELSMLVVGVEDIFKSFLIEVEFYHKHHIDYRGLISMGLAIDATGLNIYKEETK